MTLTTATKIRLILCPLLLTSVLFPDLYQPSLDFLWESLLAWSVYNWSSFETIWTVFWYALIEVSMTVLFMRRPELRFVQPVPEGDEMTESGDNKPDGVGSLGNITEEKGARKSESRTARADEKEQTKTNLRVKGMRRPSRRIGEILTYIAPLLAMDFTMIKKFRDVEIERIVESGGYILPPSPILSSSSFPSPHTLPPKTFLVPTIHNITLTSPLQLVRALPHYPPSSRRLALELVSSLLIYDALFFLFHLSLHALPPLRRLHLPHHQHHRHQIHPQVTNQLSIFERLGLVMLANFSLNVIGAHVLTRTVFVILFVWLLVEIHCGMDLGWGHEKVLPRGWAHGAKGHWKHHVGGDNGEGGYEPYFAWWDDAWLWWAGRRGGKGGEWRGIILGG